MHLHPNVSPIKINPIMFWSSEVALSSLFVDALCFSVSRNVTDLCRDASHPHPSLLHALCGASSFLQFIYSWFSQAMDPGTAHRCLSFFITPFLCSRSGIRELWCLHTHSVAGRSRTLITLPHAGLLSLKLQPIDYNNIFITIILCLPKHLEGPLGPK